MQISDLFKESIANTFYDKDIEIWTSGTIKDDEGAIIGNGKQEKIDTFKGNFQFQTREKLQEQYGQEIEANAIVTCDVTVGNIGDVLVHNNEDYEIKSIILCDSHTTILVKGDENV